MSEVQTIDDLSAALRAASRAGQPVVPLGAGTRMHIGYAEPDGALRLSTAALDRVLEYEPPDLTVTVEAGAALAAVQAQLMAHGQWLPWDPPRAAVASIGGLLASAASGPLRQGYGTPRDWVLGMRFVLGDGRVVKSGGRVVKNVAGYDSHKLQIGALGTLGVIAEVTFKVAPVPQAEATLVFEPSTLAGALELAAKLRTPPLNPARSELTLAPLCVTVSYAGVAAAVERQVTAALALGGQRLDAAAAAAHWQQRADATVPHGEALLLRAGAAPGGLAHLLDALRAGALETWAYPGVGLAWARWPLDGAAERLAALRAALTPLGGYAAVEHAPEPLRATLDLWGPPPPTIGIMRALRQQWDPAGILNAGRYLL